MLERSFKNKWVGEGGEAMIQWPQFGLTVWRVARASKRRANTLEMPVNVIAKNK